ncbi:MAG: PEGA domain-containing protein [Methanosarcinales archaeon]|nr:PEGA domain-containing protein [Methanosarcinales archaeon]
MYRTVLLAIIIIASISNCCAETSGKDNITFTDTPYTVYIEPGSDASFNATLKNAGVGYVDVSVIVRSVPDWMLVNGTNKLRVIRRGRSMAYPITIHANRDAEPGTYHFEIADQSRIDRRTWEPVDVHVMGEGETAPARIEEAEVEEKEEIAEIVKSSPELGFIRVRSYPPAADVHLDNVYQGATSEDWFWIYNVTPGNHTVSVEKYGYERYTETVSVSERNMTVVSASISEIPAIPAETAPEKVPAELIPLAVSLLAAAIIAIAIHRRNRNT